jgi:hypothetical protein
MFAPTPTSVRGWGFDLTTSPLHAADVRASCAAALRAGVASTTHVRLFARPVLAAPLAPRTQLLAGGRSVARSVWLERSEGRRVIGVGERAIPPGRMGRCPERQHDERVDAWQCVPVRGTGHAGAPDTRARRLGLDRAARADASGCLLPANGGFVLRSSGVTRAAHAAAAPDGVLMRHCGVAHGTLAQPPVRVDAVWTARNATATDVVRQIHFSSMES